MRRSCRTTSKRFSPLAEYALSKEADAFAGKYPNFPRPVHLDDGAGTQHPKE